MSAKRKGNLKKPRKAQNTETEKRPAFVSENRLIPLLKVLFSLLDRDARSSSCLCWAAEVAARSADGAVRDTGGIGARLGIVTHEADQALRTLPDRPLAQERVCFAAQDCPAMFDGVEIVD